MPTSEEPATSSTFAPVYVERLRIRNFRGIVDLTMDLDPDLTVLVGRNNVGKSRVLSALLLALGGRPADGDDFTVNSSESPSVDVYLAPGPGTSGGGIQDDQEFEATLGRRFGTLSQVTSEEPVRERFAWRTHVRRSAEGLGARSESKVLTYDLGTDAWAERNDAPDLRRDQRQVLAGDLVNTGRDLMEELGRRGSSVRRILSDLEVPDEKRTELESALHTLGKDIVSNSRTLGSVATALTELHQRVGSMGSPHLNPIPISLEELSRSVSIDLDGGDGPLPIRLHGAGSRSLSSLQVQGVLYERRLGSDGPAMRPQPVTLIEEPEAHLHPQAEFELAGLLGAINGQKLISTHSSHVVTVVPPESIRLLRTAESGARAISLRPADPNHSSAPRALRPGLYAEEMEKLKRLVERPFGELVFANGVVIGDGATERSFLPVVLRHALGRQGHGICVIDPGSLDGPFAIAAVKFAEMTGIPWVLFADSDDAGQSAVTHIQEQFADSSETHVVWIRTQQPDGDQQTGAFEAMMVAFDSAMCIAAAQSVKPSINTSRTPAKVLSDVKGSVGSRLAQELIDRYPETERWPEPLRELIGHLEDRR